MAKKVVNDSPSALRKNLKALRLAELKDLKINTTYYINVWGEDQYPKMAKLYIQTVRGRRKKGEFEWYRDESEAEFEEYKDYLRTIVKHKFCLIEL